MDVSQSLFPASFIPLSVQDSLPDGFVIRPLTRHDYGKGFYDCLRVLTWVGEPTESEYLQRFDEMAAAKDTYFFAVFEYQDRIVGTGCLVVEKKLYAASSCCRFACLSPVI